MDSTHALPALFRPRTRRTRGAALVQYVVMLGLVALLVMVGMNTFGGSVSNKAEQQARRITGVGATSDAEITLASNDSRAPSASQSSAAVSVRSIPAGEIDGARASEASLGLGSILLLVGALLAVGGVVVALLGRAKANAEAAGAK